MPGESGFETCTRLTADPATADIPIIFISGLDDVLTGVRRITDVCDLPLLVEHFLRALDHGWWQAGQTGATPADPSPGLSDDDVERLNTAFYQAGLLRPLAGVQDDYRRSYAQVMAMLQAAPAAAIEQPGYFPWAEGQPFAYFTIANTSDHYQEHRLQIAAWLEAAA